MILGLPAAKRGRGDVRALKDEVSRKLQREARKDKTAKAAGEELERLGTRKAQLEQDRDSLKAQVREVQQKVRVLDEGLKQYEESREDAGLREAFCNRSRLRPSNGPRRKKNGERSSKSYGATFSHPSCRARPHDSRRSAIAVKGQCISFVLGKPSLQGSKRVSILEAVPIAASRSPMTSGRGHAPRSSSFTKDLDDLRPLANSDRVQELAGIMRQLRAVAPAGKVDAVRLVERSLDEITLREYRLKQDLERVNERLALIDTEALLRYDREAKQLEALRGEMSGKLRDAEKDLDDVTAGSSASSESSCRMTAPCFSG